MTSRISIRYYQKRSGVFRFMKEQKYQRIEQKAADKKIILEFPIESQYTVQIEKDIKEILFSELQAKIKEICLCKKM